MTGAYWISRPSALQAITDLDRRAAKRSAKAWAGRIEIVGQEAPMADEVNCRFSQCAPVLSGQVRRVSVTPVPVETIPCATGPSSLRTTVAARRGPPPRPAAVTVRSCHSPPS